MNKRIIARSVSAILAGFAVQGVSASGFQLLEQNASGLGNAYSGSAAVSDNASTIFFNPAGMTELKDHEISLGGALISPSYKFTNNGSSVAPASTGGNGGDAGTIAFLPNAYLSWALNKDWYLGLGMGAPFGLKTEYDDDWVGRFQSTMFEIKTYNINPSIAWRLNDKVSLGAGLNWQRMEATYERFAATASLALPSGLWPALQGTKVTLDVDNDAWGWNAGALFKLSPATKLGVSYRSAIKHKLDGTLTSTNQTFSPNVSAKVDITLPDTFIVSVSQQLGDKWEALGDLTWTGWSKIDQVEIWRTSGAASGQTSPAQTLDAHFRDTWRIALGANYKVNDVWKLKYGIAYDQTPVRDASTRLVSLPDNDRVWFTFGTQWKPTQTSALDLGIAYIYVRDAKIDNNQSASGRGRVTGEYSGRIWLLGAQYSMAF